MGLLIGIGATRPTFSYDYYYGIEWDTTVGDSACTRIGRAELHASLPVQSLMRRCLLRDDGTVYAYLNANDSLLTDTGADADLSGTYQVMVEIPEFYLRFEMQGTKNRCMMSMYPLPGFFKVNKFYISAYEAALNRVNSKLYSAVNLSVDFRGGNNNADYDGTSATLLGKPVTNLSITKMREYARNRGSINWNINTYLAQKILYWLVAVEYADFNNQLPFNATLTAEGYHQGGLGNGVTDLNSTKWDAFNGQNPVIPCGYTNSLGNNTGELAYNMPAEYDPAIKTVYVPSYRGIENIFGHILKITDGCKADIQPDAGGGLSKFYTCDNPANYQDVDFTGYTYKGNLPRVAGYITSLMLGEYGDIAPLTAGGTGASATTFICDYITTDVVSYTGQRMVIYGGHGYNGLMSGNGCIGVIYSPLEYNNLNGSRLCYMPL